MDIRSFFNTEYSKLQIANERVVKEAEKTEKILQNQINEFDQINRILKGFIQTSHIQDKKIVTKEVNKFRKYQRELVSSVKSLIAPAKQEKTEPVKTQAVLRNPNMLLTNIKMSKVEMNNVVIKMSGIGQAKQSQSSQNFNVSEPNQLMLDKIQILKRIDKNLSNNPRIDSGEASKESEGGGFGNISGIISGMLGGSVISKLLGKFLPKLPKLGTVAKGAAKFGKKAIPIIGAVFSVYDLFKTIKTGISDYNKYTKEGDYQAASGVISSSLMGAFGNIINIIGAFLPPPLDIAALTVGTGMELVSNTMAEKKGRTSGFIGEARNKNAQVQKTISIEQGKGEFVELRTNFKDPNNIFWEYNNGSDWVPVRDNGTGKNVPNMKNNNPIIPTTDPKKPGIQTYQITTKQGIRDIVMKNGQLFMNVPNVGLLPLSTRKQGGTVVKNRTYLVGEHRAETYVSSKKDETASLKRQIKKDSRKTIDKIDNSFKLIDDSILSIKNFLKSGTGASSNVPAPSDNTLSQQGKITPQKTKTMSTIGDNFENVTPQQAITTSVGIKTKISEIISSKGKTLTLKLTDGSVVERTGNINWRAHNPGNIRPNKFSLKWPGVVGSMDTVNGKFLVFDSYESGRQALYRQLFEMNSYKNLTISSALQKYAPASDKNDPVAYAKEVIAVAGKDGILSSFDETTRQKIIDAFQKKEGYVPGKEVMNSFAVGSWKLDSDQEAFIHKGEMIIPETQANKIRALAKSGKMEMKSPEVSIEYDIYSDASFWINTFMPALANVVLAEFGETNG